MRAFQGLVTDFFTSTENKYLQGAIFIFRSIKLPNLEQLEGLITTTFSDDIKLSFHENKLPVNFVAFF